MATGRTFVAIYPIPIKHSSNYQCKTGCAIMAVQRILGRQIWPTAAAQLAEEFLLVVESRTIDRGAAASACHQLAAKGDLGKRDLSISMTSSQ